MSRCLLLLPLLALAPLGRSAPPAAPEAPPVPAGYHQVRLNGHTFTLPEGFTIELVAGPPLVERPIVAAFDEKGRLYVCDSSGSNEKVTEQVKKKPHRVVRLEDKDGDGHFDKAAVYVPNVMFPEGAMWLDGSLYVAAPPQILKFTDKDDDGRADVEEVWYDGQTLTGCANDLHGPYLGPDGWVYWCKGAFAKQDYGMVRNRQFTTRASHILRMRPDGGHFEVMMTGGMDNPVDVVFTPGGERIFSTTFFQHPAGGKRDGLIHAVYGGVYGKDHDPVYEHPWTSPSLMPVLAHMGPAAPCGLHRYESDQFGQEYENNLFCCQFNLRKVSRHVLVPSGSTFVTKDSDFVVSDNLDFHPTDVIEDADGSLLIMDTGGWYKLCCPSSQLVKADVTGAIYRVKKAGAHKVADPRGLKIDWDKLDIAGLAKLLNDPRPAVQRRAIETVGKRGECATVGILALASGATERGVLNALWLQAREYTAKGQAFAAALTLDPREEVRIAALHHLALYAQTDEVHSVWASLGDKSLRVRRAAAEALGRMGNSADVDPLLKALADERNDRVLDHSLTYALIEINRPKETRESLRNDSPRVRRAVLAALQAMPDGKLIAAEVLPELDAKDPALRETAWWIAGKHPEWGEQLVGYFKQRLKKLEKLTPPEQDELVARLVPLLKSAPVRKATGDVLAGLTGAEARPLLRGLARSGLKSFPDEWTEGVLLALYSRSDDIARDGISVLRSVPPSAAQFAEIVAKVEAYRRRINAPLAKELDYALRATAPPGTPLETEIAKLAIGDVHRDRNGPVRAAATALLARSKLPPASLIDLTGALTTANPVELPSLLPAFGTSTDEKVGLALVRALGDPALRSAVRAEQAKPILDKYPPAVRGAAEKLYALLAEARAGERDKLELLLKEMPSGDVRRGQIVFNGAKAQCIACHKVGYVGGTVGPDLTRVGGIRSERDLLESIVFPSASFVRSYEPVKVTTAAGRDFSGILKKDAPDEIILVIAADKEERIARADVESITPGTVSVMPSGFDQQLTPQQLADLVAFLKACK
jgi:putative membrane-bound dehydrogenase-like protein